MSRQEAPAVTIGERVHLRSDWPERWTETDQLVEINGTPVVYEVTAIEPGHEAEVTGGTATIGTHVTVRPTVMSGPEMAVPIGRVVPVGASARPHP
jgi:hypothetical protein